MYTQYPSGGGFDPNGPQEARRPAPRGISDASSISKTPSNHMEKLLNLRAASINLNVKPTSEERPSNLILLDIGDYYRPENKDVFLEQLAKALKTSGFFAICGFGIENKLIQKAFSSIKSFFNLPFSEKSKLLEIDPNCHRGYNPGANEAEKTFNYKEFFHIGRELLPEKLLELQLHPNLWPEDHGLPTPLQDSLEPLFNKIETQVIPIQEAISLIIGQERHFLRQMTQDADVLMRAIHYPPAKTNQQVLAGDHSDISMLTVIPAVCAEGLQIKNTEGQWEDVIVPPDSFVINAGDILENLTNGIFKSGRHRLLSTHEGQERYSILMFLHPKPYNDVSPLPLCIERLGHCYYPSATRQDLFNERLASLGLATYDNLRQLAQSGLVHRQIQLGKANPQTLKNLQKVGLASPVVERALEEIS